MERARVRACLRPRAGRAIHSTTGELYVSGPLDYETRSSYPFEIRLEVNSTNNYTAIVFVNVSIAPVDCPAGSWSQTGTYPCALHLECAEGHNETAAPTQTSDRICLNTSSSEKEKKKTGLIVGLLFLFLLFLILLLLFCYKRKRDQELEEAEKASSSSEVLPTTAAPRGGMSDAAAAAAEAPVYGLASESGALKGATTAPLGGIEVQQPYKMATGAPLYETAGAYGPNGTQPPAASSTDAVYDAAGGNGEKPYDPFGKNEKPVYGRAAGGNVAEGGSPMYDTAGAGGGSPMYDAAGAGGGEQNAYGMAGNSARNGGPLYEEAASGNAGGAAPMYDTAAASNAAIAAALGASGTPAYGLAAAGANQYDTAGARAGAAVYDDASGGAPLYDAAAAGRQSLSKRPSFSEGAPMYDVAGQQMNAGDYDVASAALLNAAGGGGGVRQPLQEALYDQASGAATLSGGSVLRSRSYDNALNTVGLASSEPMYTMASAVGNASTAVYDAASGATGTLTPTSTYDAGAAIRGEGNAAAADGAALYDAATPTASSSLQAYDIADGAVRIKSVRRGNPMYRDSVYIEGSGDSTINDSST